ncbi:glycosyltransferase family protein [Flavobacterium solisilvae]|uniref:Glycosyltransferase family 4 protein n=1 Tax=Flavobacterium solisilvae TaxID=1852019 RepID=A0ABX1QUF0_9FLAO|nr:hypothetical protein [Flavobacterium solisilvae]NMH25348.1 glycosyltransferase family 4 protein [Flavobacterium solisilvae]
MKKNILIISYSYPPLNVPAAQRPYALAKYLDKSKYNITVITCKNPMSYLGFNKCFNPTLDNVSVIKINSYIGSSKKNVSNNSVNIKKGSFMASIKKSIFDFAQKLVFPDRGMFWYPKVKGYLKKNKELLKHTDVVLSLSPMINNHRIARYVKRRSDRIKWIADFSDFYYVDGWVNKTGIKAFLHKRLEYSIIKEATSISFVTKTMQKAYQKFYPQHWDKMHCSYNGFDRSDFIDSPKYSDNDKLTFFYAGTFYNGLRSPLPLMQLLDKAFEDNLLTKDEVQIQIAGNIDEEQKQVMRDYKSYCCVDFLGNLPRTEVLQYMCKTTFLWLIVANIKSHYQTIPIKLFEYIAAKRPIVNFAPIISESSQIIQEKNLGYNFNTLDFNVEESYAIFKDLLLKYKQRGFNQLMPNENLESFTWEYQIRLLEEII